MPADEAVRNKFRTHALKPASQRVPLFDSAAQPFVDEFLLAPELAFEVALLTSRFQG